ncbi:MAG: DUF3326 domain-containing protein [Candidatus Sericytochromatia bacterium]|nr:DUF3326 domain-containing protein [Candidatus Sericytochromatia bacterium]
MPKAAPDAWVRPRLLTVPAPSFAPPPDPETMLPDPESGGTRLHAAVVKAAEAIWHFETFEAGPGLDLPPLPEPGMCASSDKAWTVTILAPTGLGLATGGFAGDATPAVRLLAATADRCVTHPNAVNAAALNWAPHELAYVEGGLLDGWLAGRWDLLPRRAHTVGVLLDAGLPERGRIAIENALGAFRTVGGGRVLLDEMAQPLRLSLARGTGGRSVGSVEDATDLIDGACRLRSQGATALAIVSDMSALALHDAAYASGSGPDPIGGLEAMLSRVVGRALGMPTAHAPWLPPSCDPVDPRGAAEELGLDYLLCILRGLQRAPVPVPPGTADAWPAEGLLVFPATAAGGSGTLAAASRGLSLLAVRNPGVLDVTPEALGLSCLHAASWPEAAGLSIALREGLAPETLARPLGPTPTRPVGGNLRGRPGVMKT